MRVQPPSKDPTWMREPLKRYLAGECSADEFEIACDLRLNPHWVIDGVAEGRWAREDAAREILRLQAKQDPWARMLRIDMARSFWTKPMTIIRWSIARALRFLIAGMRSLRPMVMRIRRWARRPAPAPE